MTLTNYNPGTDDLFVAKFDGAGNCLWAKRAGGGEYDGGYGLALDTAGSVYITGDFYSSPAGFGGLLLADSSPGYSDIFLAKLAPPPPQIVVSPPTLDFGNVAVGGNSLAAFTLANLGGTAITNGSISTNTGPFTTVSGTMFTVPAFGSTNVQVRFAPSTAGSFSDVVVFSTANGGKSTNALTGIGALAPVAAFTASPTNGITALTVSFTDNSTGTITNRFWDFGDETSTNTTATTLTHTYTEAGAYTVGLTVGGPVGGSAI